MRGQPTQVGALIKRLRKTSGHLGKPDRETCLMAVDAILELSQRLYDVTHAQAIDGDRQPVRIVESRRSDTPATR